MAYSHDEYLQLMFIKAIELEANRANDEDESP